MINYFRKPSSRSAEEWQAQLETWLEEAQEALATGQTVMRVRTLAGNGGTETESNVEVNVKERIERLLYALFLLDPEEYPASETRRVTRTQIEVYPYQSPGGGTILS